MDTRQELLRLLVLAAEVAPAELFYRVSHFVRGVYPLITPEKSCDPQHLANIAKALQPYESPTPPCDCAFEPNLPTLLREKNPHALCVLRRAMEANPDGTEEVLSLLEVKFPSIDFDTVRKAYHLANSHGGYRGVAFTLAAARRC